jgi:hypothetical protein
MIITTLLLPLGHIPFKGKQQRQELAVPRKKKSPLIEEDLTRIDTRTISPPR